MSAAMPLPDLDREKRRLQSLNNRRKYVEGCSTCEDIRDNCNGFGPKHDASERCQSGWYEHCSCDSCF